METRSNHVLVGAITLALLAALLVVVVWLAGYSSDDSKRYDIFYKQAVTGLAKGSSVVFAGVPTGQVEEIALMPRSPDFVRVRISVRQDTPILQGTTASIAGVGFTGVSQVTLDGAVSGAQPITQLGPYGVPVIPTKPGGGLAGVLDSAPVLLERVSSLTERLTELLSDRNQSSIAGILDNTQRLSDSLADRSPEIAATLAEAQVAIRQTGDAAARIGELASSADRVVSRNGDAVGRDVRLAVGDLRQASASAESAIKNLDAAIGDARPGLQAFTEQTVPEAGLLISDLRDTAQSLSVVAERLERGGATSILGAPKLPDYEGQKKK